MTQEIANSESPEVASLPRRRVIAPVAPSVAHFRKCIVCHHPHRALIELSFIGWRSPSLIARQFGISDRGCIYRHAHATNLFEFRRLQVTSHYQQIIKPSALEEESPARAGRTLMAAAAGLQDATGVQAGGPQPPMVEPNRILRRAFTNRFKRRHFCIATCVRIRKWISLTMIELRNLIPGGRGTYRGRKMTMQRVFLAESGPVRIARANL